MLDNLPFSSLRLLALITHFIVTTGLLWTRNDSLQVTLKASASRNEFKEINSAYIGIISFALISLALEIFMLLLAPKRVSLFSALKLFLDVIGSFFITWIILDGLEWLTYVYIFVFCVTIPTALEIVMLIMEINKDIWVDWRGSRTIFHYLWEGMEYVRSWIAYITACLCTSSPRSTSSTCDFSAITASCMGCLAMLQSEGISGICQSCWQCLQTPFQASPSALFESCFNSISSICTSTTQCCSSLGTALMQGPTGIIEFCTTGLNSCGQEGSILQRIWEFFAYIGTAISSSCSYLSNGLYTLSAEYGPIIYESLIALRDYIWSWLMWIWRQIRLFCT